MDLPKLTEGSQSIFQSFWMGGYECTDQLNAFGNRVDFMHLTGHAQLLKEDYELLRPFNIQTVREGIRWSQIEKVPYQYDFSLVSQMIDTGKALGIQQIWDICHFGFPDDLTPLHPMFARRFAALCRAFVHFYRSKSPDGTLIVTPINEASFLSWLGGDARGTAPYCTRQGWEVKYALMRAYIEGSHAMKEIDPTITIMSTEPLANMVPPLDADAETKRRARECHDYQYQAMDMLTGRICPELGGAPHLLDLMGVNYYYNNQWVYGSGNFLPWRNLDPDPRWRPLRSLFQEAYNRYKIPLVLSETSHPLEDRPLWITYIAQESAAAIDMDIPLEGVCLYPIIDRPDWDHLTPWHKAGLWDADISEGELPGRLLYEPYAEALLSAQALVADAIGDREVRVSLQHDKSRAKTILDAFPGKLVAEIPAVSKIG